MVIAYNKLSFVSTFSRWSIIKAITHLTTQHFISSYSFSIDYLYSYVVEPIYDITSSQGSGHITGSVHNNMDTDVSVCPSLYENSIQLNILHKQFSLSENEQTTSWSGFRNELRKNYSSGNIKIRRLCCQSLT